MRLKSFNYSGAHTYFITIVVENRAKLFTENVNGQNELNAAGRMVEAEWICLEERFNGLVRLHGHVVMADHFHGLIEICPPEVNDGLPTNSNNLVTDADKANKPLHLGQIIGAFKSITTVAYIEGVQNNNWKPFKRKVWQRCYHDSIIRNGLHFHITKRYIRKNLNNR
jgi:putative transposase